MDLATVQFELNCVRTRGLAMPTFDVKVIVTHRFKAPPDAVFDAWITGNNVRLWFSPGHGPTAGVAVDPRPGGAFLFVQRRGDENVEHIGKYEAFDRPHRLAFTWQVKGNPDSSRVQVDLIAVDGGTALTLTHEQGAHWAPYVDRTKALWQRMLAAMASTIE